MLKKLINILNKRKYILLAIVLIFIVWLLPLEDWFGVVNTPNQNGNTYFKDSEFDVRVSGGFLYRIETSKNELPKTISIKQTAPQMFADINVYKNHKARFNIINSTSNPSINISGNDVSYKLHKDNIVFDEKIKDSKIPSISQLQSYDFINSSKGIYFDANLIKGENDLYVEPKVNNDDLKFTVISDFHSGYEVGYKEITNMMLKNYDFIIFNGDIVDYGNKAEFIVIAGLTESSPIPVYTNIGNHEDWLNGEKFYRSYFGPSQTSFNYKNSLFMFLDTQSGLIKQAQFDWLVDGLRKSNAKYKFVITHMPALDASNKQFDDKEYEHPQMRQNVFKESDSQQLIDISNQYNVSAIFAGHDHIYGDYETDSVRQVFTGAIGGKMSSLNSVSYLDVSANNKLTINNIEIPNTANSFNKEHFDHAYKLQLFAKPYFYDKWLSILASFIVVGAIIIVSISIRIISKRNRN